MRVLTLLIPLVLFIPCSFGQIVPEQADKRVYIFKNTPLAFEESSSGLGTPALDSGNIGLEIGDVNGDGHVDLVSIGDHGSPNVGSLQHGIMVWFGNGTGAGWVNRMTGNFGYGDVALGDLNNDGLMDVGYGMHHNYSGTDLGDQYIEAALGDGTGMNWTPWDDNLAADGQDWGMFGTDFADVDADGDLDLMSVSFGSGDGLHVYLNNGDGTWTHSFGFLDGNCSSEALFGDVNGDGYPDIAAGHQDGAIWLGDGAGGFVNADGNLPDPGAWSNYWGPDLGDIDLDGCQDFSFCMADGTARVFLWRPGARWADLSQGLPAVSNYDCTQLCDMDGDGRLDLVLAGEGESTVWRLEGGTWTEACRFSYAAASPGVTELLRTADVDRNGRPDVAVIGKEGAWPNDRNKLRLFLEKSSLPWPRVRLTHPTGHETLHPGAVVFVDWVTGLPAPGSSSVTLRLSTSGPGGPFTTIASGIPDSGRYQWIVPSLPPSSDCFFKISVDSPPGKASFVMQRPFSLD